MATAEQLNAEQEAKRDAHLKARMRPMRTQWPGRNPVGSTSGHDVSGHRAAPTGIGNH